MLDKCELKLLKNRSGLVQAGPSKTSQNAHALLSSEIAIFCMAHKRHGSHVMRLVLYLENSTVQRPSSIHEKFFLSHQW
jgi:hypothetical protein